MKKRYTYLQLSPAAQKVAEQWYLDFGPHWGSHVKTLQDASDILADDEDDLTFDVSGKRLYPDGKMEG